MTALGTTLAVKWLQEQLSRQLTFFFLSEPVAFLRVYDESATYHKHPKNLKKLAQIIRTFQVHTGCIPKSNLSKAVKSWKRIGFKAQRWLPYKN